jgi:mRNA degradation ribonuclease J1/J2
MPGIDYIIPNTKYLEENKKRIKGVIITHGHLDHIGAIPYILPKIGDPPIYTMKANRRVYQKALGRISSFGTFPNSRTQ